MIRRIIGKLTLEGNIMEVTEEESKSKLCPKLMSAIIIAQSMANIDSATEATIIKMADQMICHGSDCMAWQWFDGEYEYAHTKGGSIIFRISEYEANHDDKPDGDDWEKFNESKSGRRYRRLLNDNRRGQCGLANLDVMVETQ